jgi:Ca2+-binding EF-hand superfamily protein
MRKVLCGLVVAALFAPGFVQAADKPKMDKEAAFKKMDKNADGKLSLEEFTGKRDAEMAKTQFAKLDKDKDGSLSLEEFKAAGKKAK